MKRLVVIWALLLTVAINSFGQEIQTKFLGLTIGEEYTFGAEKSRVGGYIFSKENKNDYIGYDVRFGGYDWDFVWISMLNEDGTPNHGKFRKILFESYFEDEMEAKNMANALHDSLHSKYGENTFTQKENQRYGIATWNGSNNMICKLSLLYSKSDGGEMYWYVDLLYYDLVLSIMQASKDNDEL